MRQSKTENIVTKSKAQNAFKDIYCISGLGADRRVFQKLKFKGYQPVHIDWLEPNKKEDIAEYAKRLTEQIKSPKPILLGLSFGGIIAVEITKHIKVEKVILVSSAKQSLEIPVYFRMFRQFPIHHLIPFKSLLGAIYWLINWFFSLENLEERKLLKAILIDTDAKFLKWAPMNYDKVEQARKGAFIFSYWVGALNLGLLKPPSRTKIPPTARLHLARKPRRVSRSIFRFKIVYLYLIRGYFVRSRCLGSPQALVTTVPT